MSNIEKVDEFLTKSRVFYLSTTDGDQPRCRPLGLHLLDSGRIYFGVGDFKEVYRQMLKNPRVEICATVEGEFLRYYGKAVFESGYGIAERALEVLPSIKPIYNEQTGHRLMMFFLESATAEFHAQLKIREKFEF